MQNEFDNLARSLLDINAIAKRAKAQGLNFDANSFATMTFIQKLQYLQHISGALSSNINDETYSMMKSTDATQNQLAVTAQLDLHLDKANSSFMKLTGGAAAFIPAAILLSGKASEYNMILGQMHNQTDLVTAAFLNMRGTLAQSLKMLEIRFQNILIVLGLQLIPVVTNVAKSFLGAVDGVMAFVQSANGLEIIKQGLIGLAILLTGVVVPAIVSAVMAAAPFTLTLIAVATVCIFLGKAVEAVVAHFGGMDNILRMVHPVIAAIGQALGMLGRDLHKSLANPAMQQGLQQLKQAFIELLPTFKASAIFAGIILVVALKLFVVALDVVIKIIPIAVRIIGTIALVLATVAAAFTQFVTHIPQLWSQMWSTIGRAIGNFFSGLGTMVHNGLGKVGEFFGAAFAALGRVIDDFATLTPQKIETAIGYAIGFLIALPIRGVELVVGFTLAAMRAIDRFVVSLPARIAGMATVAVLAIGRFKTAAIQTFVTFVTNAITTIQRLITEAPGVLLQMAIAMITRLKQLVVDGAKQTYDLGVAIINELKKLPGQALAVIKDFIQGIINGIKNGAGAVWDAIKNMAGGMINGFKNALGIHSPSTIMFAMGTNLSQGLINGFKSLDVAGAWLAHTAGLTNPLVAPGLATSGISSAALAGAGGGGTVAPVYNVTIHALDGKDAANQFEKMIIRHEQTTYRRSRRPGGYSGVNAG
jgi:hypothetical protein